MSMSGEQPKTAKPADAAPKKTYETRDTRARGVVVGMIVSVFLIVIVLVLMNEVFLATKESVVYENVLSRENSKLRELRAEETRLLTTYAWIDSSRGVVRIPIKRAMELEVDEAYRRNMATKKRGN